MARRRWGDRVANNDVVDWIMGACFRVALTGLYIGIVVFVVGFFSILAAGLAPFPYNIQMETILYLATDIAANQYTFYILMFFFAAALAIPVITALIVVLNEIDKIVIHRRL